MQCDARNGNENGEIYLYAIWWKYDGRGQQPNKNNGLNQILVKSQSKAETPEEQGRMTRLSLSLCSCSNHDHDHDHDYDADADADADGDGKLNKW